MKRIIYFIIILSLLYNCSVNQSSKITPNKEIIFPDSLALLKENKFYHFDSLKKVLNNRMKIISIYDATCLKCIDNLNKWHNIMLEFKKFKNLDFLFVLNVEDSSYFMKYLYPEIKIKEYLIFDKKNSFFNVNHLDERSKTLLLSENNELLTYGNPAISEQIKALYLATLIKASNKDDL